MISNSQPLHTIVTGATTGVGLQLAVALAHHRAHLTLGVRDDARGDAAVAAIREAVPGAVVEHRPLDLSSLASVRAFCADLPDVPIDRLVLNAAVMTVRRRETRDGLELMIGTNAFGHFALVARLLDRLRAAGSARVVTQSSESHRHGRLDLDDLQHRARERFSAVQAYHDAKLAQHVLAVELARRVPEVSSVVAQPGWVRSELGREVAKDGRWVVRAGLAVGDRLIGQTPQAGARAAVLATLGDHVPDAATGLYVTPSRLRRLRGMPHIAAADPGVLDAELGTRLWAAATELTGVGLTVTSPAM